MKRRTTSARVAIGLRVKTGRAIAVVLRASWEPPIVVKREELILSDPGKPEVWQPFHPVMELPWEEAAAAVSKTRKAIQATASKAMRTLVEEICAGGFEPRAVGIVGGSSQDPAKIGNPHIRAHAAEGRLYREVLEAAADACGLSRRSFQEKNLYAQAASRVGGSADAVRERVSALGAGKVRPWRADEKLAAVAAWMALAE